MKSSAFTFLWLTAMAATLLVAQGKEVFGQCARRVSVAGTLQNKCVTEQGSDCHAKIGEKINAYLKAYHDSLNKRRNRRQLRGGNMVDDKQRDLMDMSCHSICGRNYDANLCMWYYGGRCHRRQSSLAST